MKPASILIALVGFGTLAAQATAQQSPSPSRVQQPQFAFVAIKVTDMAAALLFYRDQLGLTEQFRNETGKQVEVGLDFPTSPLGSRLLLILDKTRSGPLESGERLSRIAFYVKDIDASCRTIAAAGGMIVSQPVDNHAHKVKVAFARDPDGNNVELLQPYD